MPERPYCDRFIPSRRGTSLQDSFALLPDSPLSRTRDTPQDGAKDDNLDTYQMLLRSELLGGEPQQRRKSDEMTPTSLQGNLFRYRSVMQLRDDAAQFAVSPVGSDSQRVLSSPRRVPRKIPTVPYKVRECEGGGGISARSLHCLCTVSALSLHARTRMLRRASPVLGWNAATTWVDLCPDSLINGSHEVIICD